jgi:four helix bundle protein
MATVASYRDLMVWQRAIALLVDCYQVTEKFPRTETYGLCSQLQRAAVSVPSNIAEGAGRGGTKEFIHHLGIARGSLYEVETQLIAAERIKYLPSDRLEVLLAATGEIGRMLNGLIASLERKL